MSPRLIIFDCDGTLVDSQHLIVAAMNRAFEDADLAPPGRDAVLGIVGLSLPEAIRLLAEGAAEATIQKIREGYSAAFGALRQSPDHWEPMYEGARDAVVQLADEDGVLLGIATGKSKRGVNRLFEHYDLTPYFATIQTADDSPSKPHPGMIRRALEETGVEPARTAMIGDTSFDMAMARNAGVAGLGVSWGYHPVHLLEAEGVHGIAEDYPHLLRLLGELFAPLRAAG